MMTPPARAPGILRADLVRPRKLGHIVVGSTDHEGTSPSTTANGQLLLCRADHHNVAAVGGPVGSARRPVAGRRCAVLVPGRLNLARRSTAGCCAAVLISRRLKVSSRAGQQ